MDTKHASLLRSGFDAYLARLDGTPANLLPYDFDQIDRYQWSMLGGEMVKDELREITNACHYLRTDQQDLWLSSHSDPN